MKMDKLPCEVVKDLLPTYLDGLASERTKALIEEHIESCGECRAELESMKKGEPEPALLEGREIDFLKKNRRWNRRIALLSVLGALVIAAGVLFVKFYIVGSDDSSVLLRVDVRGNRLSVVATAGSESRSVRRLSFEERDGVVNITAATVMKSPFCAEELSEVYEAQNSIEKVKLNGSTIYEVVRSNVKLSDEISTKIKESWQEYNAMSPMDRMATSGTPGYVRSTYASWEEAVEAFGFSPFNPFENNDAYEKKNYAGTDVRSYSKDILEHAEIICVGNEEGIPTEAFLTAGYSHSGIRVVYTVSPMLSYYDETTGSYITSGISLNLGSALEGETRETTIKNEYVSNGKPFSASTVSAENGEATCLCYTLSNVQYNVRISRVDGEADERAYDEAVNMISDMIRNILINN